MSQVLSSELLSAGTSMYGLDSHVTAPPTDTLGFRLPEEPGARKQLYSVVVIGKAEHISLGNSGLPPR